MPQQPNVRGMVNDPDFQKLGPAQQREALAKLTGDSSFSSLSDPQMAEFMGKLRMAPANYGEFARNLAARSAPKVPTPAGLQGPPSAMRNLSNSIRTVSGQTLGAMGEGVKDIGRVALGVARMGGSSMSNLPGQTTADLMEPLVHTALTAQNPVRETAGGALGVDVAGLKKASQEKNYPMLAEKTIAPIATILAGGKIMRELPSDIPNIASASDNLIAALKPSGKVAPKVQNAIKVAQPELESVFSTDRPTTIPDMQNSLQKVSLGYESQFQNYLKPHQSLPISTTPIADRIQAVIAKDPYQAPALQPLEAKYRGQTMTIGELNSARQHVSGVEKTGINDLLYGTLEKLNPVNAGDISRLRQSQSAILTIQDAAKNRAANLITPDAIFNSRPTSQRVINAAVSAHITRPATIPLAAWRMMNQTSPSGLSNARVAAAGSAIAPQSSGVVGNLVGLLSQRPKEQQ